MQLDRPDALEPVLGEERVFVAVHAHDSRPLEAGLGAKGYPQPRFWGELVDPPAPPHKRFPWVGDRERRLWREELDDIIDARFDRAGNVAPLRARRRRAERDAALKARIAAAVDERLAATSTER